MQVYSYDDGYEPCRTTYEQSNWRRREMGASPVYVRTVGSTRRRSRENSPMRFGLTTRPRSSHRLIGGRFNYNDSSLEPDDRATRFFHRSTSAGTYRGPSRMEMRARRMEEELDEEAEMVLDREHKWRARVEELEDLASALRRSRQRDNYERDARDEEIARFLVRMRGIHQAAHPSCCELEWHAGHMKFRKYAREVQRLLAEVTSSDYYNSSSRRERSRNTSAFGDDGIHFKSDAAAVVISGLREESSAWLQGMRIGDQLLTLNGMPTFDSASFVHACDSIRRGDTVVMMCREQREDCRSDLLYSRSRPRQDHGRVFEVVVKARHR